MEAERPPPAIVRRVPYLCPSDRRKIRVTRQNADFYRNPRSTVAQMFSQELMDIFRIDNSVADLDEKVDKRSVTRQTSSTPGHKNPADSSPTATPHPKPGKQLLI